MCLVQISGILHLRLCSFEVQAVGKVPDAPFDHNRPGVHKQVAIVKFLFDGRTKPKVLGSIE